MLSKSSDGRLVEVLRELRSATRAPRWRPTQQCRILAGSWNTSVLLPPTRAEPDQYSAARRAGGVCVVSLSGEDRLIVLEVVSRGRRVHSRGRGLGGYGLVGMRERWRLWMAPFRPAGDGRGGWVGTGGASCKRWVGYGNGIAGPVRTAPGSECRCSCWPRPTQRVGW